MPKWIHERKEHIQKDNPKMDESMAWALATEQAYATGKSPAGYGSKKSRQKAKKKYKKNPSSYEQVANPKSKKRSKKKKKSKKKKSKKSFLLGIRLLEGTLYRNFPHEAKLLRSILERT